MIYICSKLSTKYLFALNLKVQSVGLPRTVNSDMISLMNN